MNFLNLICQPTAAYIDPSSVTILVSSISGIVIAIGATAVILFRKAKKKVSKALNLDDVSKKEVEDELVINEAALDDSKTDAE